MVREFGIQVRVIASLSTTVVMFPRNNRGKNNLYIYMDIVQTRTVNEKKAVLGTL